MKKDEFIAQIEGGLIVSCQALPGEPLYRPEGGIMPMMAEAAYQAGAAAIRTSREVDVRAIMKTVPLPVIGLIKKHYEGYTAFITPTMEEVDILIGTGCSVIAVDATPLTRPGSGSAPEFIESIKRKHPDCLLMADCSSFEDAAAAAEAGADFIGTTMNGYVYGDKTSADPPDFDLVKRIADNIRTPLIAEGRIHRPEQAAEMLRLGALAVVVGGAITRPKEIAESFIREIGRFHRE